MTYPDGMSNLAGPASHTYISQRLRLHYVDWGNESAPPLIMVHGGRDHCRNWDWMAERLRDRYHIIAPDLRGHGDSQWMVGSSYNMVDYVYDIAQLTRQLKLDRVTIMAHSMGAGICAQYAGTYPKTVDKLIAIEGWGPPPYWFRLRDDKTPKQLMREWIHQLRDLAGRLPRRYGSLDECVARMREANPHLSPEHARHLTIHGVAQNEDGTFSWKFDNYVRTDSPYFWAETDIHALWQEITCPVLLIRGTESWTGDPNADGRTKHLRDFTTVAIEQAGHWVHHDQLDQVMDAIEPFLAAGKG